MDDIFIGLNPEQIDAVVTDCKHVLVLAGAGSGKTKTITSRIIHLLKNENVYPDKILALTFTNKAAGEMRERVVNVTGEVPGLMIKTFHSFGALFLRKCPEGAGRRPNFVIYDDDDARKLLDKILETSKIPKADQNILRKWVKHYKQNLENDQTTTGDAFLEVYQRYNDALKLNNAFDFEDLILYPVKILMEKGSVYQSYQRKLRYILVDEYQDTNYSQYMLLQLLSGEDTHLMVVGDEDQSIYRFRGADVSIILNFPKDYPDTQVIRLEKNYRSTSNILNVANAIIAHNEHRLGKTLYAINGDGQQVTLIENEDDYKEAETVVHYIRKYGYAYDETAVLVRTNNQTRVFEQVFRRADIPYIIVGGIGFYEREEVRDALAILRWLSNSFDRIAFERFVNKPSRGIGKKSLDIFFAKVVVHYSGDILDALRHIDEIEGITGKALAGFKAVYEIVKDKESVLGSNYLNNALNWFLEQFGLIEYYTNIDASDGSDRIDNLKELLISLENVPPGEEHLTAYLEDNALISQADAIEDSNAVKILTVHNAKGLEFTTVFICGIEKDIFPHTNSILENEEGLEEERRLFYVAITRAKQFLYLLHANSRTMYGVRRGMRRSEFVDEIPQELLELISCKKNDTTIADLPGLKPGDMVRHKEYGAGKVLNLRNSGKYHLALIDFYDYSCAEVILEFTQLEIKDD